MGRKGVLQLTCICPLPMMMLNEFKYKHQWDNPGGSIGMRVLVTGARLPAALEITSGLTRLGVEVFAADSLFFSPTGASYTISQYLRFPSPRFFFQAFRSCILEWVDKFKIDLIIPVSEEIFFSLAG